MGRQIEYYMEIESFQLLVKKAFELGFKVVQNDLRICASFNEVSTWDRVYFFLEEAGQLVVHDNIYIDAARSPVVETGVSYIDERKRTISNSRIWVSSGYWRSEEIFIKRNELLDKKYSSLMRYVKKLAPYTEVEVKAQNPLYNGEKYRRKVYITPFLLNKTGEYDCI